ncbi:MAG: ROK family protein [Lachnospiraceae bacterium]|nr:ROK family protein [Lachnospiraceae bacterium]
MKVLVYDYGGTFVKYSVMDENKKRYASGEVPAPTRTAEEFVAATKGIYDQFKDEIEGITISFPGFVDSETTLLSGGGAYSGIYINTLLKDAFDPIFEGKPWLIENDGKCGALAESWGGALEGADNGIVIILGTGVAGGLVQKSALYKGKHYTAGELSFTTLDWNLDWANSAQCKMTASALVARIGLCVGHDVSKKGFYQSLVDSGIWKKGPVHPDYEGVEIDGLKAFEIIKSGYPAAVEIYNEFCKNVAAMIINLGSVYDPEVFAIGGGISRQDMLIPDIIKAVEKFKKDSMLYGLLPTGRIERCVYQGDANQYGAMYNYLTKFNPELVK